MANEYNRRNIRQAGRQLPTLNELMERSIGVEPEPQIVEKIVEVVPENAIVALGNGNFAYKRFNMSPTGLTVPEDTSGDEWLDIGWALKRIDDAISWWVGDWALYAMEKWEWSAAQVAEQFGYKTKTIETYASICRGIHGLIRNQAVSFGHHRPVAVLDEMMQQHWLEYAAYFLPGGLTINEFKSDMIAVGMATPEQQIDWIRAAMAQGTRLSQIEGLQPPALLPPERIPSAVIRGKKDARRDWKALEQFVEGRTALKPDEIREKGRALIAWIEQLMEASE